MLDNLDKAKAILQKYNQEHLLAFYNELNNEEKEFLINQICQIDFKQILDLYEASKIDEVIPHELIEPLPYTVKSNLSEEKYNYYNNIGEKLFIDNKCAVVTMAGGQRNKAWT